MEKEDPKGGIYKILNKINGRVYIGSSKKLEKRLNRHKYELKKGVHHNKFLQNDFNKLGKDFSNIEFSIIEYEDDYDKRLELEYEHITFFSREKNMCYNHDKNPKALKDGECFGNSIEKTKKKISDSLKKAYSNPESAKRKSEASKAAWQNKESRERRILAIKTAHSTEKTKEKMANVVREQWADDEKRKGFIEARIKSGRIKPFKVIKNGEIVEIVNLSEWCRENGMCEDSLFRLREGRTKKHKGLTLYIEPKPDNSTKQTKLELNQSTTIQSAPIQSTSNQPTSNQLNQPTAS